MKTKNLKEKVLNWLATGEVGASSKCMAFAVVGLPTRKDYPSDAGDFNRCLKLIRTVPEIKKSFPQIATISDYWKVLIEHWDELESLFLSETSLDGFDAGTAPKTYKRMRELLNPIMDKDINVVRLGENLTLTMRE